MAKKIIKNLIYAQVSFFFCLIIDVFITTKGFSDNRGLSFYGQHLNTAIPFALGFFLCDIFLLKAAKMLPEIKPKLEIFSSPLRILALLLILIALTPDKLNDLFSVLHTIDAASLFLFELVFAIWLAYRWSNTSSSWVLVSAQFISGVVAGLSEIQVTHYLSEGTLIYQLIFSSLLILSLANVVNQNISEEGVESIDISERQAQAKEPRL